MLLESVVELDRPGQVYPEEGATGTVFPFQQTRTSMLEAIKDTWTDNGFVSLLLYAKGAQYYSKGCFYNSS